MLDFAIKSLTLAIVAVVCFFVVTEENRETDTKRGAKVHLASYGGDLDVVTIEAEKPAAIAKAKPESVLAEISALPLESYKPSVKSDETKDKLAALDERVTQLESKFKTFAASKPATSGGGSSGGAGSTGTHAVVTSTQSSVGYGSTGSAIATTVYPSQAVSYAPQPVRRTLSRLPQSSPKKCVVDQYGRVICR